jgi:hypothetical protein
MTWYNNSWLYRKEITINGDYLDGDLVDFPVFFKISGIGDNSSADGTDIIFVDGDDATRLNHELVTFSGYSGNAWIKIPSITDSTDKSFYIYYGNTGGGDQTDVHGYRASSTWDNYYVTVCHMNDSTDSQSLLDVKSNRTLKKPSAGTPLMIPSYLGSAQVFECNNTWYISSARWPEYTYTSSMSVEIIVSGTVHSSTLGYLSSFYNEGGSDKALGITVLPDSVHRIGVTISTNRISYTNQTVQPYWPVSSNINNTQLLGVVFKSGNISNEGYLRIYNGADYLIESTTNKSGNVALECPNLIANSGAFIIGNRQALDRPYSGAVLEFRTSRCPRSTEWINTASWNISTMSAYKPYLFYTIGVEEPCTTYTERYYIPAASHFAFPYYFSNAGIEDGPAWIIGVDGIHFSGVWVEGGVVTVYPFKYSYDLAIYYNTLEGDDFLDCRCSRWDISDYNVVVETWLRDDDINTLFENIKPGAIGEFKKILGKPHYYDKTWTGKNTLRLLPTPSSSHMNTSTLRRMRRETIVFPKNITTSPIKGSSGWTSVKIEGAISGSQSL